MCATHTRHRVCSHICLRYAGAGKTTTISMLTGLLPMTAGDATMRFEDGREISVRHQLSRARRSIGICPQHDVLYPDLTVEEHLDLFAVLKGVLDPAARARSVERQIRAVQLAAKRHTAAGSLSGGTCVCPPRPPVCKLSRVFSTRSLSLHVLSLSLARY